MTSSEGTIVDRTLAELVQGVAVAFQALASKPPAADGYYLTEDQSAEVSALIKVLKFERKCLCGDTRTTDGEQTQQYRQMVCLMSRAGGGSFLGDPVAVEPLSLMIAELMNIREARPGWVRAVAGLLDRVTKLAQREQDAPG